MFYYACEYGVQDLVEYLLPQSLPNISSVRTDVTRCMLAAAAGGHNEIIDLLIRADYDADVRSTSNEYTVSGTIDS